MNTYVEQMKRINSRIFPIRMVLPLTLMEMPNL